MAKEEARKEDFEKRIIASHPKFLETVKEIYPLAVLGSLCTTVAVFAQTYPEAQAYAITAASLFLLAYVASFFFKIIPTALAAFVSFGSTAMATLFLFLVVIEFGKTFPMVSKTASALLSAFYVLLMSSFYFILGKVVVERKSRTLLVCGVVSISSGALFIAITAIAVIESLLDTETLLSHVFDTVAIPSAFTSVIFIVITFYLIRRTRRP